MVIKHQPPLAICVSDHLGSGYETDFHPPSLLWLSAIEIARLLLRFLTYRLWDVKPRKPKRETLIRQGTSGWTNVRFPLVPPIPKIRPERLVCQQKLTRICQVKVLSDKVKSIRNKTLSKHRFKLLGPISHWVGGRRKHQIKWGPSIQLFP